MSARIQVIGDEVWADGYHVATLVTDGVPATVSGAFRLAVADSEARRAYGRVSLNMRSQRSDGR